MQQLADTRVVQTLDDAKAVLSRLRELTCERELRLARAEKRIQEITAETTRDVAPLDIALAECQRSLRDFIVGNPGLFVSPRMVVTPDGKFGLRRDTRLEIDNEEALVEWLEERGYTECFRRTVKPLKAQVLKRLNAGEPVPHCRVLAGDIAGYDINKALVDAARRSA